MATWEQDLHNFLIQASAFKDQCEALGQLLQRHQGTEQGKTLEKWLDQLVNAAAGTFTSYAAEVQASELTVSEGGYVGKGRADAVSPPFKYSSFQYRGEAIQIKVCRAQDTASAQALLAAAFNQLAGERFEVPLYDENLVAQLWMVNELNPWPWEYNPGEFNSWSAAFEALDARMTSRVRSALTYQKHEAWKGAKKKEGTGMPSSLLKTFSVLQESDVFAAGYDLSSDLPRRIRSEYGWGRELVGLRVRISLGRRIPIKLEGLTRNVHIYESEYLVTRADEDANRSEMVVTPLAHLISIGEQYSWYYNSRFVLSSQSDHYGKKVFWYRGDQPVFAKWKFVSLDHWAKDANPKDYVPAWVREIQKFDEDDATRSMKSLATRYIHSLDDLEPGREKHTYYKKIVEWREDV